MTELTRIEMLNSRLQELNSEISILNMKRDDVEAELFALYKAERDATPDPKFCRYPTICSKTKRCESQNRYDRACNG